MKTKLFTVQFTFHELVVDTEIAAESLEQALEKAKTISIQKCLLRDNVMWNDGKAEVTGVIG